jgi:hypothetical protein
MDIYAGAIQSILRDQGVDLPHTHAAMTAAG